MQLELGRIGDQAAPGVWCGLPFGWRLSLMRCLLVIVEREPLRVGWWSAIRFEVAPVIGWLFDLGF
jgi:hypothetical protein